MQNQDYSTFTSQIQDIHIKKVAQSIAYLGQVDQPKLSYLLLLSWCTVITGYHTSSDNSNTHQQPMAGYRQTNKLLLDTSQPRRAKFTTNRIYVHQFKYTNTISTVLCMSNDLICGYITGIHDKRIVMSCLM